MAAQHAHTQGPWRSWRVIVEGVGEIGFAHGRDEQDAIDHALQDYGQLGARGRHAGSSRSIYEDDDYRVEEVGSAPMKIVTPWGTFTLVKRADKDYEIGDRDGAFRIGRVVKRGRGWYTERGDTICCSRHDAVHLAVAEWYQKHRATAPTALKEKYPAIAKPTGVA